jgi:outer membrane protein TolC
MLQKLLEVSDETSSLLNAVLELTENIYNGGSMTISTTDFLKYQMYMSFFDTIVEEIVSKNKIAKAALLYSMGLSSDFNLILEEAKPLDSLTIKDHLEIVDLAYSSNPLWKIANSAKNVFQYKIDEVNSEYYPRFGLFAGYTGIYNSYIRS